MVPKNKGVLFFSRGGRRQSPVIVNRLHSAHGSSYWAPAEVTLTPLIAVDSGGLSGGGDIDIQGATSRKQLEPCLHHHAMLSSYPPLGVIPTEHVDPCQHGNGSAERDAVDRMMQRARRFL